MTKKQALGFGFIPSQSQHHFLVIIPSMQEGEVVVYERFVWEENTSHQIIDVEERRCKAVVSKYKFEKIKESLKAEFNNRLKANRITVGKWATGEVPVERLLGKEMLLLVWAIEDCDPSIIPNAIKNWLGLSPEERWWLFTMTNATTGYAHDKRGWRKAIRYALTENPTDEKYTQGHILEMFYRNDN